MSNRSSGSVAGKLSKAERKLANRAAMLKTQAAEYASAAGIPAALAELQRGEERAVNIAAPRSLSGVRGRPSEYTEETAADLCGWIAGGGSLLGWCREHGRSMETVYRWMRQNALFQARYAQAHEDRADTLADEMLAIADASASCPTIESVAAAKLRVETRRFIASKLRPQKWGDNQRVEHTGAVSIRIGIPRQTVEDAVILPQQTPPTP